MSVLTGGCAALIVLALQTNFPEITAPTPVTQSEFGPLEKATVETRQSSSQEDPLFFLEEILRASQRLQRFA